MQELIGSYTSDGVFKLSAQEEQQQANPLSPEQTLNEEKQELKFKVDGLERDLQYKSITINELELQVSQLESKIIQISDDNASLANSASKAQPTMPLEVSLDGQISSKFQGLNKITALQHQLSQLQESNDLFKSKQSEKDFELNELMIEQEQLKEQLQEYESKYKEFEITKD